MSQRKARSPMRPLRAFTVEEIAYCNRIGAEQDPAGAELVADVLTLISRESDNAVSSLIGMAMGLCVQGMKSDGETIEYCEKMLREIRARMFKLLAERGELAAAERLRAETGT